MVSQPIEQEISQSTASAVPKYLYSDPRKLITDDARFAGLAEHEISSAVDAALARNFSECSHNLPLTADKIFSAHSDLKAGTFTEPKPMEYFTVRERPVREPKKITMLKDITNAKDASLLQGQRFAGGVNLAFAALSAIFAIDAMRKVNKTDELGQNHVQWTHVGIAVLNTALAAGLGYAGYKGMTVGRGV